MKNTNNRKGLSIPVIDIIIVVIIVCGIAAGVIGASERGNGTVSGEYRIDLMLYDANGEKIRLSDGSLLYFDDGSLLGTTKKFESTAYASGSEKYNASVFAYASDKPDALYCGNVPLPVGSKITLHTKTTSLTAEVIGWSAIGEGK